MSNAVSSSAIGATVRALVTAGREKEIEPLLNARFVEIDAIPFADRTAAERNELAALRRALHRPGTRGGHRPRRAA